MLKLNKNHPIREIKKKPKQQEETNTALKLNRPEVVDAKVYKVKSPFVKFNVYVTLSYVLEHGKKRPIEIFINSKDLTHVAEYAVLTRLISAIFRRADDPHFILEELRSIYDPNGGYFKSGKYIQSFYSEVADVIERFFIDEKIISQEKQPKQMDLPIATELAEQPELNNLNDDYKICPDCNGKGLKFENGCEFCVLCGFTKCDK
ncbi:MAG: hypothetical protein U9N76_02275 [Candidatus Marinimicrobia bacterium]|nr:hypothetical protein [Candidatus Neomarinimicrobiota bacterium]